MPKPRIFYFCYDSNEPAGGEKHSYQHVDILNRHGFDAYALHKTPGFRLTWFDNATRVAYWPDVQRDYERDFLVVPESLASEITQLPGKKIIFNKNIYYGFSAMGLAADSASIYLSRDVVAVLSVSSHNSEYLKFAYPGKAVFVVNPGIRSDIFTFRDLTSRKLQIAYAVKGEMDGRTLFQLLAGRSAVGLNKISGVQWMPMADLHETQVVDVLQNALLLVFLSVHEGLGRLPLEAMACGCLVCAYDCGPPARYLPEQYRFPYGDLLSMARRIEEVVGSFPGRLSQFNEVTCDARRIAETFSTREQERAVIEAWTAIYEIDENAV